MSSPIVLVSWYKSPAKTFAEAMERELVFGGTGAGSASVQVPLMLNSLVGTKFKVIPGYPGGSEIYLAMEKGEVDGRATQSWAGWKSQKPDWIKEKKINLLAQGGIAAAFRIGRRSPPRQFRQDDRGSASPRNLFRR